MERAEKLVEQLSCEIDAVETYLRPVLDGDLEAPQAAQPPVVAAYALGSLLFAYLKSEGEEVAPVLAELERVKAAMQKVDDAEPVPRAPSSVPGEKEALTKNESASDAGHEDTRAAKKSKAPKKPNKVKRQRTSKGSRA